MKKLNTTAYHPQCDGMVERFNRTLKGMLTKHAARFGMQWDTYLHGVLWAYRNTPHESTGEKPSFLLYGHDCRSPTEAALLPSSRLDPVDVEDYREEMVVALSEARELAVKLIRKAQQRYQKQYDKRSAPSQLRVGDWVFVYFPQEESGRMRKLSRPWFGPYRITSRDDPDVTVTRVYSPKDPIQVHLTRVAPCPTSLPAGLYWYGAKCKSPDQPPKWVETLLRVGVSRRQEKTAVTESLVTAELGTASPETVQQDTPAGCVEPPPQELTTPPVRHQVTDVQEQEMDTDVGVEKSGPPETGDDSTDLTEPVVPETKKVYPLRSRQRQARGKLVGRGE